ncbi:MAG TPA: hypothetical protein PLL36_09440 [Candidatus Hydrogenedentes bacterium]|nr:hypothetical protein [Candidatus Hydrogenedentota bacterium]
MTEPLHGGPAATHPAVTLELPEVVLADFSPALSGVVGVQVVSGAVQSF